METRPQDSDRHYCLFDTAIGACGIAWSERGVTRLQLPEADRSATERRLARAAARADPPPWVEAVIEQIRRYLTGRNTDFAAVAVDLGDADPFNRQVYAAARAVGWGRTATYGDIARAVGAPAAAREVGRALAQNPVAVIVPCHRIVASGNRFGGFSAYGGAVAKARLLALEGVDAEGPLLPGIGP